MTADILDPRFDWLRDRDHLGYSQYGEEGLIRAIIDKHGEGNRWCFEIGAGNGVDLSNTKALRDEGWSAVLIDSSDHEYEKLQEFNSDRVFTLQAHADMTLTLDGLLHIAGAPHEMTLGVIDIDGQDYWVWSGLERRPSIMLVEYDPHADPGFVPKIDEPAPAQAGLDSILRLGISKDYDPVARTHVNVLFLSKEYLKNG